MSGAVAAEFQTLLLFWISMYLSAVLAKITHLSPLLFYLLFGCIYGNTGVVHESHIVDFIGEVAITIVFLALGFEESTGHFVDGIKKAWGIAIIGAVVPFACGFSVCYAFYPEDGLATWSMAGLAVTATAVSLTMISLKTQGLAASKAAIGIMTSAVLDDVMCLALVAIMIPVATGESAPTLAGISWVIGKCLLLFAIIIVLNTIVFPVIRREGDEDHAKFTLLRHLPGIRSVGIHHFVRFDHGEQAVLGTIIIGFAVGVTATSFGFHPAIGAYFAGLILEDRYFDCEYVDKQDGHSTEQKHAVDELHVDDGNWTNVFHHVQDTLESAAFGWLGPIFFLNLGSKILIEAELLSKVIGPALAFFAALFVGQILSATIAARYVPGGFNWVESWMIGFGMLGRAELFMVVLDICYVEHIFSQEVFFALTLAAMLLNICVPIAISLYKPYYLKHRDIATEETHMPSWFTRKVHKGTTKKRRRMYRPSLAGNKSHAHSVASGTGAALGTVDVLGTNPSISPDGGAVVDTAQVRTLMMEQAEAKDVQGVSVQGGSFSV